MRKKRKYTKKKRKYTRIQRIAQPLDEPAREQLEYLIAEYLPMQAQWQELNASLINYRQAIFELMQTYAIDFYKFNGHIAMLADHTRYEYPLICKKQHAKKIKREKYYLIVKQLNAVKKQKQQYKINKKYTPEYAYTNRQKETQTQEIPNNI